MAVNPIPLILETDQFLLNRDGATYKTPFTNLAENVLNLVLDGNNSGENSLIVLNDLGDVDINSYIKERNAESGNPELIGNMLTDRVGIDSKFWILQHVDSRIPREDGEVQKSQFVLADPRDAFRDAAEGVVGTLELNRLVDVTTRLDGSNLPGVDAGPFLPHTAGDSFLLCVSEGSINQVGEVVEYPDYQPRSISNIVSNIINLGPNAPGGGIQIDLETIVDVNPIYINNGTPTEPDLEAATIRLEVNDEYKNGVPGAIKYTPVVEAKNDDDILVYITRNSDIVDQSGVATLGPNSTPLLNDKGQEVNSLPAGWYYAENVSDGTGKLEPAGIADETSATPGADHKGDPVKLGGVRVLNFRDTEFARDANDALIIGGDGNPVVGTEGTVPTNIGITKDGVLYADIPNTLSFVQVIDIVGSDDTTSNPVIGGAETFGQDASGQYIPVPIQGPGNAITPETWDPATSLPTIGDFYVVRFVELLNPDGTPAGLPAGEEKTLIWNNYYPDTSLSTGQDGPRLKVRNGDIVVFGNDGWSVMGTVTTDEIAQDLQSVTDRGFTTTNPIKLTAKYNAGAGNSGLIVGQPVRIDNSTGGTPGAISVLAADGVTATEMLIFNNIEFSFIKDLADAPTP